MYMNNLLYTIDSLTQHCPSVDGRVVVFAFGHAAPVFLQRLLEVSSRGATSLGRLAVVCLPWMDTVTRSGSQADLTQHLTRTGRVITRDQFVTQQHVAAYRMYASMVRVVVPAPTAAAALPELSPAAVVIGDELGRGSEAVVFASSVNGQVAVAKVRLSRPLC